jgi:hypothetical protein
MLHHAFKQAFKVIHSQVVNVVEFWPLFLNRWILPNKKTIQLNF